MRRRPWDDHPDPTGCLWPDMRQCPWALTSGLSLAVRQTFCVGLSPACSGSPGSSPCVPPWTQMPEGSKDHEGGGAEVRSLGTDTSKSLCTTGPNRRSQTLRMSCPSWKRSQPPARLPVISQGGNWAPRLGLWNPRPNTRSLTFGQTLFLQSVLTPIEIQK